MGQSRNKHSACNNPELIEEVVWFWFFMYGSSVDAKILIINGALYKWRRDRTHKDLVEWIKMWFRGIGEILLTSIDNEGTGKGFDIKLIETVIKNSSVPIIISGGRKL